MEAVTAVPIIREQAVWLTDEEAFTLLTALVRGAAMGSAVEDSLLAKIGDLCRSFLKGGREIPIQEAPELPWVFDPCEAGACLQAA